MPKLLSDKEIDFLKNPGKFNRHYQKALRYRIKKKVKAMMYIIIFVQYSKDAMQPNSNKKDAICPEAWMN